MSRWKVHRTTDEISPWAAVYDGWEGNRLALRKAHHGTWAEAMAYADRETQPTPNTVTIQDPSGTVCDLTATTRCEYIHLKAGDDTFNLMPHEWKPLARFLLDVDHRKEHE